MSKPFSIGCASHLRNTLSTLNFDITVEVISKELKKLPKITHLVVTGMSGAIIGGAVSYVTKLPLIVIRKENDTTHSPNKVEVYELISESDCFCFLDDFISGGNTINHVFDSLKKAEMSHLLKFAIFYDAHCKQYKYKFYNSKYKIKSIGLAFRISKFIKQRE